MEEINAGAQRASIASGPSRAQTDDELNNTPVAPVAPVAPLIVPPYKKEKHMDYAKVLRVVATITTRETNGPDPAKWTLEEDQKLVHLIWRAGGPGTANLWRRVADHFGPDQFGATR